MENIPEIIREMRQTRSLEKIPVFHGAGDASPLHWWHVFMSMLGRPSTLYLQNLAKPIGDLRHRRAIIYCDINLHPFLGYERRLLQRLA